MSRPEEILAELVDDYIELGLETAELRRPVLGQVGIIDFSDIFGRSTLVSRSYGCFPKLDGGRLYPDIFELREQVYEALGTTEYAAKGFDFKHFLYPIENRGLIADLARTSAFRRIHGVFQLGPARHYPLPNNHNRGEHALWTGVDLPRTLQILYDQDPKRLLDKLRRDFTGEGLIEDGIDDLDLLQLACQVAAATGTVHDLFTPAGGDMIKFLLGLDEEEESEKVLLGEEPEFAKEREEIVSVLKDWGLDRRYLQYIVKCVRGQSPTLIGEMINPTQGDILDWDRHYILLDGLAATYFINEVPKCLLPAKISTMEEKFLRSWLNSTIQTLTGPYAACTGIPAHRGKPGYYHPRPPTNLIDPTEDYLLDEQGRLVCTEPVKLAWMVAERNAAIAYHYAGAQMLGLEWETQQRLAFLIKEGQTGDLLTRERVLKTTDEELWDNLAKIGDPLLGEIIERRNTFGGTSLFRGRIVDSRFKPRIVPFKEFPLKIRPGLETVVQDQNGQILTLGKYLQLYPNLTAAQIIKGQMTKFSRAKVIIEKVG